MPDRIIPPATVPCSHCSTPIDAHPYGHNLIDGKPVCLPSGYRLPAFQT